MATKTTVANSNSTRNFRTPAFGGAVKQANSTYFEKSGIRAGGAQTQRPFLAIRIVNGRSVIEVIDNVQDLVALPKKTKVMHQWEGKNRSDFIGYTVGQLREYCEANPPKAGQVI